MTYQARRQIRSAEIVNRACIEYRGESYYVCMIRVEYAEGGPETYLLPLSFQAGDSGDAAAERDPAGVHRGMVGVGICGFMREYLRVCRGASFLPQDRRILARLLNALQLEKAVYELGYEINNRPGWVRVPMHGITRLLDERAEETRGLRRVA